MPDVIEQPVVSPEAASHVTPEVAKMMALSLGLPKPETKVETTTTEQPAAAQPAAVATPEPFSILKEKFQYNTAEDAVREIEELRSHKASGNVNFEFANDESKKLFEAWKAGKRDEVWNYLNEERQIDQISTKEINKDTAADIVKLGMQLKYKDLTPQEINYKFNKQFAIPNKPVQMASEDEDSYNQRVSDWQSIASDKEMELMIEAKLAKPELINQKSKLVIPDIEISDEGYAQYKKALGEQTKYQEDQQKLDAETKAAYKAFTPKSVETKLDFNDEANKISFGFQYEPSAETFAKAVDMVSDIDKFWATFIRPDGTPDRQKFLRAVSLMIDPETALKEAMNQAKNATIKASLPDNTSGGMVRQMPQTEPTGEKAELDKMMKVSLAGYGSYK